MVILKSDSQCSPLYCIFTAFFAALIYIFFFFFKLVPCPCRHFAAIQITFDIEILFAVIKVKYKYFSKYQAKTVRTYTYLISNIVQIWLFSKDWRMRISYSTQGHCKKWTENSTESQKGWRPCIALMGDPYQYFPTNHIP